MRPAPDAESTTPHRARLLAQMAGGSPLLTKPRPAGPDLPPTPARAHLQARLAEPRARVDLRRHLAHLTQELLAARRALAATEPTD